MRFGICNVRNEVDGDGGNGGGDLCTAMQIFRIQLIEVNRVWLDEVFCFSGRSYDRMISKDAMRLMGTRVPENTKRTNEYSLRFPEL